MLLHLEDGGLNLFLGVSRPQINPMNINTIDVIRKTVAEDTRAVVTLSHVSVYVVLLPVYMCIIIL